MQYMGLYGFNWPIQVYVIEQIYFLIIIIKLEVSRFPIVVIFFRSYMSEVFVPAYPLSRFK